MTATPVTRTLPSGRVVQLQMPDLYNAIGTGQLPNLVLAPVLRLLDDGGYTDPAADGFQAFRVRAEHVRGLYGIAALCLAEPKMVLTGDRADGELGPSDLCWEDLMAIYYRFFRLDVGSAPAAVVASPDPVAAEPVAAPSSGDGVSLPSQ